MHDDDPGDVVHDLFAEAVFGDTPLGLPVIGSLEGIERLPAETIAGYYRSWYVPERMVVAAAGHVDHDRLVELVGEAFAAGAMLPHRPPQPLRAGGPASWLTTSGDSLVEDRATEQAHVVLGTTGLARGDERRHALALLHTALGGGMSSRLFQEVREKRGLAYSVYSYTSQHADTGLFGVYAGCAPGRTPEVIELCRDEIEAVALKGITDDELARAKGQLRGSTVLDLEDTGSRMSRIGKAELVRGRVDTVEEVLARLDAVTLDDIREIAADVLRRPLSLAVIGPFPDQDFAELIA